MRIYNIYYASKHNNQVRALFTGCTTKSTVWETRGYTWLELPEGIVPTMDHRVVLDKDGNFEKLEPWHRPRLILSKESIVDDGVDEIVVRAEYQDGGTHKSDWAVRSDSGQFGEKMESMELIFSSNVPGIYEIQCDSKEFGIAHIAVEVIDG